jgi:preprotein translocase subunit SecF
MEFFRIKKDIPFMRHALVFNVISLVTFLLAVFFLRPRGLHLSVEFTGGTLIEVSYAAGRRPREDPRRAGEAGFTDARCRTSAASRRADPPAAQGRPGSAKLGEAVMQALTADRTPGRDLRRVEFVGPQVGKELAENGAMALLLVSSAS